MAALMRAYDWQATPLGAPGTWPQALRTTVRMALSTRHPVFVFWGALHVCLYNDAYRRSLGPEKHPSILGAEGRDAWPEIWDTIGPQVGQVMGGGEATWHENQLLPIIRDGAMRDVYWTSSYTAIDDETAPTGIGGVLVLVTETTDQVLAARRIVAQSDRLRAMIEKAPGFMALINGPDHTLDIVNAAYMRLVGDRDILGRTVREALPEVVSQGYVELLDRVFTTGEAYVGRRQPLLLERPEGGEPEERFVDFVYQPIRDGEGTVTGIFLDGVDVTESCRIEATLLATQARRDLLLALLQGQRQTDDPDEMMARAAEAVAMHLGANRVGFLETDAGDTFTVGTQWSDGGLPPLSGTFAAASLGLAYLDEVKKGVTLATADLDADPLTSDSGLRRAKVRSSIGAPIFRDRVWRGGLFVHHGTVRHWTTEETALVQVVANQTWDAVERARARAALAEGNAFTRLLLDSTAEGFYSIDVDGVATLCNRAFLAMLGFAREQDVVGRKLHDVIHHSHADGSGYDAADCPIYRAASAGVAAQVSDEVFCRQDGTSFPVEYRASPVMKDGRVAGAICTFVDITERKRAETALREMNEMLEVRVAERTRERDRAWRNSRDLQAVVGPDGMFRAANEAWTSILGWRPDEVVGRHHLFFNHPEDQPATGGALAIAMDGELPMYEARCLHKDGGYRWISWLAGPEEGLVYASGRHVTAEKEAEASLAAAQEALRQSQKMEAVGQLTGGIAHDFNNMLTIILGSLELLSRGVGGEDVRNRRHLDNALDGARRAALLTQRLLAFSRQQPLRPVPVNPNALLAGLSDLLGRLLGSDVGLELVPAPEPWSVEVDVNQLENVLLNLAVNARDAMPGGGRLIIQTRNVEMQFGQAARGVDGASAEYVLISLTDTGSGMPPDVLAKAFDPFFTTKEVGKGTGLGLSQVYGFVTQSGGQVRISSTLGLGTTVSLYLPRQHDGVPAGR